VSSDGASETAVSSSRMRTCSERTAPIWDGDSFDADDPPVESKRDDDAQGAKSLTDNIAIQ